MQRDVYDDALANLNLSRDALTGNRYALAGGNPVNFVEIDGHYAAPIDQGGGGGASYAGKGEGPGGVPATAGGVAAGTPSDSDLVSRVKQAAKRYARTLAKGASATLRFTVKWADKVVNVACLFAPSAAASTGPYGTACLVACAIYRTTKVLTSVFTIKEDGGLGLASASISKVCNDIGLAMTARKWETFAKKCEAAVLAAERALGGESQSDAYNPYTDPNSNKKG